MRVQTEIRNMVKNEVAAISFFVAELKTAEGKDQAITLGWFVDNWNRMNPKHKISDAGGKRIIRHIRDNGLVKRLMADQYGYFVAENKKAYDKYLNMLYRRMKKLQTTYTAMKRQYA